MTRLLIGALGRQFGGLGAAPTTPTLTVADNGNGTATVTVIGSTSGSDNEIYTTQSPVSGNGSTQVEQGSRVGDGAVTFPLANGVYLVTAHSILNQQTVMTGLYLLVMGTTRSVLTHSPAEIVLQLLIDAGQLTESEANEAWPGYVYQEPDSPDNCATVYNNGSGLVQGSTTTDNEVQEHQGVQVRVRAGTPRVCYTKINALATYMDQSVQDVSVNIGSSSYLVHSLTRIGTVMDSGKQIQSSKRHLMTVNYNVSIVQLV